MESKFDFSEETNAAKAEVQQDAKGFFKSLFRFMATLLSIRKDTDYRATIQAIQDDIPFKGATACTRSAPNNSFFKFDEVMMLFNNLKQNNNNNNE